MRYSTLDDIGFKGRKVIIRAGFDVPVDDEGNVKDDKRIRVSVPTINHILEKGAKQIILMWHMGRPKDMEEKLSTGKAAAVLSKILGEEVVKVDGWGESGLPDNKIIALENLRFSKGEKSRDQKERDDFGRHLAGLADVYVDDAFSNCHRDHASMTSVPRFIPGCVGLSVQKEIETIASAVKEPKKPLLSIFGGLKADKINAMQSLIGISDSIVVGGALAFLMLKATGIDVGDSKIDEEGLAESMDDIKKMAENPKVLLPVDCVVADRFAPDAESKVVPVENIEKGWMALDIGPATVKIYREKIAGAGTVLWFGPVGCFELEKFSSGTREIAKAMAESSAVTIIGGGDSAGAVDRFGLSGRMTLVSSGGGASLALIQGKDLPALKVLEENRRKFRR